MQFLSDKGVLPVRVFVPMKDMSYLMADYDFLVRKGLAYYPGIRMFYWTIIIKLFPKSGRFPPRYHAYWNFSE